MVNDSESQDPQRREFLKQAAVAGIGGALVLVPLGAGAAVLLDPLRRKAVAGEMIFITSIDSLPSDGAPRKFAILAGRVDAWNKFPNAPVGAIYLRRTSEKEVQALNVVCPHAGCFVDFRGSSKDYYCPCHNSSFALDGRIADPKSPSPRGLDSLEVEIRNGKEVWVRFENFQTGHSEKIPVV
jgi:menaquinol-cytochrome c reductase iron-sulfur subunit